MIQITHVIGTDDLVVHFCVASLILTAALLLVSRSRANRTAILLLISAFITASPAFADGQFGPDSDILGFKLSMTQAEAKDYATKNYPNSQLVMLPVTLNESGYSTNTVAGFMLIDKEKLKTGITEMAEVLFDPNKDSTDIIAISRTTNFANAAQYGASVLIQNSVDSVKAKFGQPDLVQRTSTPNDFFFIWGLKKDMLKKLFFRNPYGGLWIITPGSYFGEDISQSSEELAPGAAQRDFVSALNRIGTKNATSIATLDPSGQVGIMLQIRIWGTGDTVSVITEKLVDVTKGLDAFRAFNASINAGVDAVKKAKHDQLSGNTYSP